MESSLFYIFFQIALVHAGLTQEKNRSAGRAGISRNVIPYQANLVIVSPEDDLEESCSGSIIHKRWVLTAAHCLYNLVSPKYLVIVVGTTNFSGMGGTICEYDSQKTHENWNKSPINDIALIRLKKEIPFHERINLVKLTRTDSYENDIIATLSSWGSTRQTPALPRLSRKRFSVLSEKECHQQLSTLIEKRKNHTTDYQFFKKALDNISLLVCTNHVKKGGSLCHGDSGAPLVYNDTLIGIVSSSYECSNRPGLFTRVSKFIDWIEHQMSLYSEKLP